MSEFSAPADWHLLTALSMLLLRPEGTFSKASMTTSHSCLRPLHGCPRPWHRGLAFGASVGRWPGCDAPLPHAFPLTVPRLHPQRTHNLLKRLWQCLSLRFLSDSSLLKESAIRPLLTPSKLSCLPPRLGRQLPLSGGPEPTKVQQFQELSRLVYSLQDPSNPLQPTPGPAIIGDPVVR